LNVLDIATQSKIALLGGAFRWQDTAIEVTPAAKATDPFRGLRDGWWKKAEPRYADGREVILIRTRDGKVEENRLIHHSNEPPAAEAQRDKQKTDVDELEPEDSETIPDWFARIAKSRDFNSGHRQRLFNTMQAYVSRFRGAGSAKKLLDAKLVRQFLEQTA